MENQSEEKKSTSNRFFIYLSVVLTAVSGFLGYQLYNQKEVVKTQFVEIEKKTSEYDIAKQELGELKAKYDEMQTDNKQLQSQLDMEREKIAELEEMIEKYKGDAVALSKARRELGTIRNLIKSYLRQIDSLNTANQQLQAENAVVKKDLESERGVSKQLNEEKAQLNQKIEIGSKLKAFGVFANGINVKNKDKEIATTKARRADLIRCCFTIAENSIAKAGERIIYMKLTGPDGKVFTNGSDESNTFTFNGQKQQYSAKKNFTYDNKTEETCMIFRKTSDFLPGKYKVELFSDDVMIGATNLELK